MEALFFWFKCSIPLHRLCCDVTIIIDLDFKDGDYGWVLRRRTGIIFWGTCYKCKLYKLSRQRGNFPLARERVLRDQGYLGIQASLAFLPVSSSQVLESSFECTTLRTMPIFVVALLLLCKSWTWFLVLFAQWLLKHWPVNTSLDVYDFTSCFEL